MNPEAIKKVTKGAEWLDEVAPGWEGKLSFQELDLNNGCDCVLGQVFFNEALEANVMGFSHRNDIDAPNGFDWAIDKFNEALGYDDNKGYPFRQYGFDHDGLASYDDLQEAWIALVKNRYDTGTLSG